MALLWKPEGTGEGARAARVRRSTGAMIVALAMPFGLVACEATNQGYAPAQPVKYSHAVHAGAMQIPCQYCHTGAERGRYAGIPSASICLNCHKQVLPNHPEVLKVSAAVEQNRPIAWVRVHNLPDFVYFSHRPHVEAEITCQTCHGPVESMGRVAQFAPLTMGFCLDCHRKGTASLGRGAPVQAAQANRLTDCAVCHH